MPMMKNKRYQTVSWIGELALLKKLFRRLPSRHDVIAGAGDDCAVVRPAYAGSYDYLLKSDGIVEGVHFKSDSRPEFIGHKALGRVLSDFSAMGGEPLWVLVDLVAPPQTPVKRIEKVYAGMTRLAKRFNVSIAGGDVSSGRELHLHVFGAGRVKKGRAILRSGAKAGEAIFVTGALGNSLAGKHLNFQPRLREGQWLVQKRFVTAMIDISDGLLRDLGHIVFASGVGARLMLDKIPISASVAEHVFNTDNPPRPDSEAHRDTPPPEGNSRAYDPRLGGVRGAGGGYGIGLYHALTDGEDYELLFTVPKQKIKSFLNSWQRAFRLSCVQIGWITAQKGKLEGIDGKGRVVKLNETGFEHFR